MNKKVLMGLLVAPWVTGAVLLGADRPHSEPEDSAVGTAPAGNPSARPTPAPTSVAEIERSFARIDRSMQQVFTREAQRQPEIEAALTDQGTKPRDTARQDRGQAMEARPLWTPAKATTPVTEAADSLKPRPIQRVSLNGLRLSTMQAGDSLQLPPINGMGYSARVQSVSKPAPGLTQVTASIEAHGGEGSLTLTQGEQHTFGTIATPSDTFELEAIGDEGSIFFAKDFDHLIDPTKSDFIVISEAAPTHPGTTQN